MAASFAHGSVARSIRQIVGFALLVSSEARAATPEAERLRLSYRREPGAERCPGDAEIGRRVAARIARDPFSDDAERAIDVVVKHDAERWRAEIRVLDRDGRAFAHREPIESTAPDCQALADAVVLAIALAIDPDRAKQAPMPAEKLAASPEAKLAPACPDVDCPERACPACPALAEHSKSRGSATLRSLGAIGVLPGIAWGVGLSGELEPLRGWSFGVAALYLPEVETNDGELAFGLSAIESFACARALGSWRAELSACGGLQLGGLHASSLRLEPVDPGDRAWVALMLGPRARFEPVRSFGVEIGVAGAYPLIAHEFVIRGRPGSAYHPAAIGGFGWLGAGFTVP